MEYNNFGNKNGELQIFNKKAIKSEIKKNVKVHSDFLTFVYCICVLWFVEIKLSITDFHYTSYIFKSNSELRGYWFIYFNFNYKLKFLLWVKVCVIVAFKLK